jgi:uncharacterized repeat protein (TIGR01451 family)/LPXTG-motif cell wall-anchored protein
MSRVKRRSFWSLLAAFLMVILAVPTTAFAGDDSNDDTDADAGVAAVSTSVLYGIDDSNVIWEIDPDSKSISQVNATGLTGLSNSMAYDTERDQFFFVHRGDNNNPDNSLRFWDRSTTGPASVPVVADRTKLGLPADAQQPANASYWGDSYWFIPAHAGATSLLSRVSFTYVDGIPTSPVLTQYNLATYGAPQYLTGGYGDIAITDEGILYGAQTNGRFYKIDLNLLSTPGAQVYTEIKASGSNPSLQLSFNADYTILYGHSFIDGEWYTIDTTNGNVTPINFSTLIPGTTDGFRDLGGAADTGAPADCVINNPATTNNQTAPVNTTVPNSLEVLVTTAAGEPAEGAFVEFSVTAGGGVFDGLQSVTVITDANGVAVAPDWKLGATVGTNTVSATIGTLCEVVFTATATAPAAPAISLTKTVTSQTPAKPGDVMNWDLLATNTGNVTLTDVVITDTLINKSVACGTMPPGATCKGVATYPTPQGDFDAGRVFNTATVVGTYQIQQVSAQADATTPLAQNPAITLEKSSLTPPSRPIAGDEVVYTFRVTNTGNVTLTDVTIIDPLIKGLNLQCPADFTGALGPNDWIQCAVAYPLKQSDIDNGEVVNTATAVGTTPPSIGGQVTSEDTNTSPLSQSPALTFTKTLTNNVDENRNGVTDTGDRLNWKLVATNTGNVTLFNVKLIDPLTLNEHNCALVAPEGVCEVETSTHTVTAAETTNGQVLNVATATGSTQLGEQVRAEADNAVPTSGSGVAAAKTLPQTGINNTTGFVLLGMSLLALGAVMLGVRRTLA